MVLALFFDDLHKNHCKSAEILAFPRRIVRIPFLPANDARQEDLLRQKKQAEEKDAQPCSREPANSTGELNPYSFAVMPRNRSEERWLCPLVPWLCPLDIWLCPLVIARFCQFVPGTLQFVSLVGRVGRQQQLMAYHPGIGPTAPVERRGNRQAKDWPRNMATPWRPDGQRQSA